MIQTAVDTAAVPTDRQIEHVKLNSTFGFVSQTKAFHALPCRVVTCAFLSGWLANPGFGLK